LGKLGISIGSIALAIGSASAAANGWVKVVSDADGTIFVDPGLIRKHGHEVIVWMKDYPTDNSHDGVSYRMQQELLDCEKETRILMNLVEYSRDGAVLNNFNYADSYTPEPVIPESAGRRVFDFACHAAGN
jgi:hypothetical protein